MMRKLVAVTWVFILVACASGVGETGTGRDRNLITLDEIDATRATNALDLVQQLRPNWLRGRGPVSIGRNTPDLPVIYVDGIRSGDPNALERVAAQIVFEIRYLAGPDASQRFGLDHAGGAILVNTRR